MEQAGRMLIVVGAIAVLAGLFLTFGARLPFRIGRLPLDIHIQRGNFSFYFPLGTSIAVSLVLALAIRLLNKR